MASLSSITLERKSSLAQSLKRLDCTTRTIDSGRTPSTSSISCTRKNGKFVKYHTRKEKLSRAEFEKARLYNKDDRFRKDPQYVFYLLHQKEMRELASGVYNTLQASRARSMAVSNLLQMVDSNNEHLESNFYKIVRSIRGTKQYWYVRQSELKCMVRDCGSPMLHNTSHQTSLNTLEKSTMSLPAMTSGNFAPKILFLCQGSSRPNSMPSSIQLS